MTVREALGGPWAAHWYLMVGLLAPTTLLVLLREIVTPFPEWWWPLASAFAQHAVAAVVIIVGGAIARRRHALIPLTTVLAIWGFAAALRGVVGGAIAESVAGVDPEYATRIGIWVVVSLVWLPPMVYAIAQFERRRLIIGALDVAQFDLDHERPRADASGAEVQQQLRQAVAESLSPALRDLQASLDNSRPLLDRGSVAELSMRLSQLHDVTADLLDSARTAPMAPPPAIASPRRALDVPPRRPWLTALLVAIATIVLIVGDAARIFGPLTALEVVISTVAASLAIGAGPAIVGAVRPTFLITHGQRTTITAALIGIVIATYLMLNSGIDPITWHGVLIVPLLAIGLVVATATCASALVLADANDEADDRLDALLHELATLRERNEQLVEGERQRLAQVMHGPVQGRIAACIMALNFHAAAGADPLNDGEGETAQSGLLVDSVLDHLRSVSRDLVRIASDIGHASP